MYNIKGYYINGNRVIVYKLYGASVSNSFVYAIRRSGCGRCSSGNVCEAFVKKTRLRDEEHGKVWLIRVCINICKNQVRFQSRHPQCSILETDTVEFDFGEQEILREISQLPIKLKSAIILYAIEGYSVRKISEI